mmetsp:Transcript_19601/g.27141  ORF Transcript_19601/g.27141 Transcript_19601/m.27141 type:complete len:414 (-) Transcript_19601:155-1396(-)
MLYLTEEGTLLRHGGTDVSSKLSAIKVGVSQLHTVHILLLLDQLITVREQELNSHDGLVERNGAIAAVYQLGREILNPCGRDPFAHAVIIHARSESSKEIDGLPGECVDNCLNIIGGHVIFLEDSSGNSDTVRARRVPVELLHTSITNERRVQGGEIVSGAYNGNTRDGVIVVGTGKLDVGGIVCNVHEGGVHHLVVNGILSGSTHASSASIKIIDEQCAHAAFLHDVSSLTITLTNKLGGFSGITRLELTCGHHNGGDSQLLEGQFDLEGLSLTLSSPDSENKRHLDLGKGEVVLNDMDGKFVQESGRNVVISVNSDLLEALGLVVSGGHDRVLSATETGSSLEQGIDHSTTASNVLLIVRYIISKACPPVKLAHHNHLGPIGNLDGCGGTADGGAGRQHRCGVVSLKNKAS